jgi:Na+/proline symporter/signal transduction histidine kinase
MNIDIDSAIFIGFLVATVVVGLLSSRGIKTVKEYAVGNQDFDTVTIAATIIATWISGSFFFNRLSETYSNGLYFMWASVGTTFELIIVGLIFAPRMHEFLGKISIAEAMQGMYGEKVQIVTSISGFIGTVGYIAVQFKVAGSLFEYCFGMDNSYGVLISALIVTLYSSLGGIRSVTFTDVIQLITFGTIIPTIAFFILSNMDSLDIVLDTLKHNESFKYNEVFDFTRPKSLYYLFLFLYMSTPIFNPPIFQRIAMAKSVSQVRKSFVIAGIGCFFLTLIVFWISILVLSINPSLDPKDIIKYILTNYACIGLKGLTLAGIMAMVMSTADSYINSTAVIFIHDFCKPLKINLVLNELTASRLASFVLGIVGLVLALRGDSILEIVITTYSFYMPIVTIPFMLGVLGFRSSGKSVLIGMGAGFFIALSWLLLDITFIDAIVPGMAANLLFLISSHYLLNQPGGWVNKQNNARNKNIKWSLFTTIGNFSLMGLLKTNTPNRDSIYVSTGIFCMIMTYSTMHSLPKEFQQQYRQLIEFITPLSLFLATALISYPLWLKQWKGQSLGAILTWNIIVFSLLVCCSFIFVLISNFAPIQLMIFMINLIIIASLLRWQLAITMVFLGIIFTLQALKLYLGIAFFVVSDFKIIYLFLLLSAVWIAFLKPKQEYQELTEEKNEHLNNRLSIQNTELEDALALKTKFLNNIPHEYHAAMTGVISTSEILRDSYDKLSDKNRKIAIDNIFTSSISLKSFDDNITTLARLSKPDYELHKEDIDFSTLVYDRVQACRKYYEENTEDHDFVLNIEDDVIVNADKGYMIHLLDNLIMNTIKYCKKGKISVALSKDKDSINFVISDEGIGIPKTELYDIFKPFVVSSKTLTPAGGRGVGLAVCWRILEVHGGTIKADSDGEKGAMFSTVLPL